MSLRTPRLRHTLAFRLTLWYAGIFALSSCIAFFLFYTLITSVIRDRTDQELAGQVRRFAAALASEGIDEVTKAAVIEAQAAGVRKVFFRLLYANGVAFSSSNMAYWQDIAIRGGAIQQLLRGTGPVFETVVIPGRKDEVRILYAMLSPGIIVQVGEAMESYSRFLDAFKGIFITTMAFLTVLAAGSRLVHGKARSLRRGGGDADGEDDIGGHHRRACARESEGRRDRSARHHV